jgi:hypothetical protein
LVKSRFLQQDFRDDFATAPDFIGIYINQTYRNNPSGVGSVQHDAAASQGNGALAFGTRENS